MSRPTLKAARFKALILCTSPRSGSTMLCRLLAATGVAGKPESWFHRPDAFSWLRALDLAAPEGCEETEAAALAVAEAQVKGSSGGVFGLRVQGHSFPYLMARLAELHPAASTEAARFEAAFGPALYVHLSRRDREAQAVSFEIARQSGLWHRHADGSELERLSPPAEPVFNLEALRARRAELAGYDDAWRRWFAQEGLTPHRVVYEDLSADPAGVLRGALVALGADPKAADGVVPATARLADGRAREWVDRLRAAG